MKPLLTTLLAMAALAASAQTNDTTKYTPANGYGYAYKRLKADSSLILAAGDTTSKAPRQIKFVGNSIFYSDNYGAWHPAFGGGGGTGGATPGVDSIYSRADSLFYRLNSAEYFVNTYLARDSGDARYAQLLGNYGNPAWITSLAWAKVAGTPTTLAGYGITDGTSNARAAISLTTTGSSGASTYNSSTGVLNIPSYAGGGGGVRYIRGTIYSKNSWSSIADFTNTGAIVAITGNRISLTAATASNNENLSINDTTCLENWRMFLRFTDSTATSSSNYGLGLGVKSISSGGNSSVYAYIDLSTRQSGYLYIIGTFTYSGSIDTVAKSIAPLSWAQGDSLEITLQRQGNVFLATGRDVNGNTEPIYATGTLATDYNSYYFDNIATLPNTGKFAVYALGGTQHIDSIAVISSELINPDVCFLGDSKFAGYFQPWITRIENQIKANFINTIVLAGAGDKTTDLQMRIREVIIHNPKQVLLDIGTNDYDTYGASDTSAIETNIKNITTTLQSAGIAVYHTCLYQPNNLWRWNFLQRTYPGYTINTYTPLSVAGALAADSVHPTSYGDSLAYNAIVSSNLLTGVTATPIPTTQVVTADVNTSRYLPLSNGSSFINSNLYQDANGNIGLGTTSPYNYGSGFRTLEVVGANPGQNGIVSLGYNGSGNRTYLAGDIYGGLFMGKQISGELSNFLAFDPTSNDSATFSESVGITGNIGLTGNLNAGSASFGHPLTITTNDAEAYYNVSTTNTGNAAAGVGFTSNAGPGVLFKTSTGYASLFNINAGDCGFYNGNNGNISICNGVLGANINFATNQSSTPQFVINATNVTAIKYQLSTLNTAPGSSTDTGTTGEIRVTAGYIYVCIATNTWVRAALSTW